MSYDLTARGDARYADMVERSALHQYIAALPGMAANGDAGFVFSSSKNASMEVDVELVSAEGDNIEHVGQPAQEVNCVNFHILSSEPAVAVEDCISMALKIADAVGWKLYDLQEDAEVGPMRGKTAAWWKFW